MKTRFKSPLNSAAPQPRRFHLRGSFLLAIVLAVMAAPAEMVAQLQATISLDSNEQVIRGFGAANIVGWRPDMTESEMDTAFGTGEGQLGFSILRLRVQPDRNEWILNLPSAIRAAEMGVTLFASPWSPPASMKSNNSTIQGELNASSYGAYANHLGDFASYLASNGAPLYAISIQNEPDWLPTYESCGWSPAQLGTFLADNASVIPTRVIAPETVHFKDNYVSPLLNNAAASAQLDIVGYHLYGGAPTDIPQARQQGKEIWMTEHYVDSDATTGTLWKAALDTGKEISDAMQTRANAYVWWYIVRYYGPISDGTNNTGAKGDVTKKGFVMSQFSRFIRPGFQRVAVSAYSPQPNVFVTAYKGDNRVVIVVVNTNPFPSVQQFRVTGGNSELVEFTPYVTSPNQNVEQGDAIGVENGGFTAILVASSVTTFVAGADEPGNNAPVVSVGLDASVDEGSVFNRSGSFADDSSAWTATVDYGDGSGVQPLALNADKTFTLSHVYGDNGAHTVRVTVTDDEGAAGSDEAAITVVNVAPSVDEPVVSPEPSVKGQSVTAGAGFHDPGTADGPFTWTVDYGDGSGEQQGQVDGDIGIGPDHVYNAVGTYTVIVTVTDKDGASGTNSVSHEVVYGFSGFYDPVKNPPVVNVVKAGQGVPVKFSLGGDQGLDIFAAGYPASQQVPCDFGLPTFDLQQTVTAGSSGLSYDAGSGRYIYVWKTDKSWKDTCRILVLKFKDGREARANFSFK